MSMRTAIQSGRRLMARTLLDRVRIADRSSVRDATGGSRDVWTPRPEVIPARFERIDDKDARPIGGITFGAAASWLHMPVGTVVDEGDRIIQEPTGKQWTVVARQSPPGEFAVSTEVLVREVGA